MKTRIVCAHCKKSAMKEAGAVNRARAIKALLFCSKRCFGLSRRKHKTKAQKVEEKRLYDLDYRALNREKILRKKRAYHKRTYDPKKAAVERKKRMPYHVEYCRRPEYKKWKSGYDREYRAREYGPFAEAYLLLLDIDREVNSRMTDYDVRVANGTLNKKLQRRRDYEKLVRSQS